METAELHGGPKHGQKVRLEGGDVIKIIEEPDPLAAYEDGGAIATLISPRVGTYTRVKHAESAHRALAQFEWIGWGRE